MVPREQCLHEIFRETAQRYPARIAVSAADRDLTYAELDSLSDAAAVDLSELGVGAGALVGLCFDRDIEMIVGILAILKAGGAYLPLDPRYPETRMQLLLRESGVDIVVTTSALRERLLSQKALQLYCINERRATELHDSTCRISSLRSKPHDLAYVIYTSGSTGTPKGVMVEHRNVVRLFRETQSWFDFGESDVWTLFHSVGFDFSVWEIWGALLYGGRLVIVPFDVSRSPGEFHALLQQHQVTVLNQTPSAFRQLIAADVAMPKAAKLDLRLIIMGGEALDPSMLEPWIERYGDSTPALVNMYGLTETTVHVTCKRMTRKEIAASQSDTSAVGSPIGIPIPDLKLHVLDASRQPVGDGVVGELYLQGAGLARGYLGRADVTAERFVVTETGRLYRTGDFALRTPDGEYRYCGRADDQLKVRGFRIEPAEIERCLVAHPRILAAAVTARDYGNGDVRLVAYVAPLDPIDVEGRPAAELTYALAHHVEQRLPDYMRPSFFVCVEKIPLTDHGKLDRSALPGLAPGAAREQGRSERALTATEGAVFGICLEALAVESLGINEDLFEVGATSLTLMRIFALVAKRLHVRPAITGFVDGITVEKLAEAIDKEINTQITESA